MVQMVPSSPKKKLRLLFIKIVKKSLTKNIFFVFPSALVERKTYPFNKVLSFAILNSRFQESFCIENCLVINLGRN